MGTEIGIAAAVAGLLAMAGVARGSRKRRLRSIRTMLDRSRPCAVRTR